MRKKLLLIPLTLLLVASLVACAAPAPAPAPAATVTAPAATVTAPAATVTAPAPVAAEYQWKVACSQTGPSFNEYSRLFSAMVEEYSDGKIEVEFYPDGLLGGLTETFMAIQEGSLTAGVIHPYTDLVPGGIVNDMPWMVNKYEEAALVYGPGGIIFNLMSDAWNDVGFHLIMIGAAGIEGIGNTIRPLKTPADFKDWKFRVSGAVAYTKMIENMSAGTGLTVETIPWADLYGALSTGVVDGNWTTCLYMVEERQSEPLKYWTALNFAFDSTTLAMNKDVWDGLPQDLKDAVSRAGLAAEYFTYEYDFRGEMVYRQQLIETGEVEIYIPTPEEITAFREAANMPAIWAELGTPYLDSRYPGQNMTKQLLDELARVRAVIAGE